jgi:glycosyltransferase involved in cell wall biosynthesis
MNNLETSMINDASLRVTFVIPAFNSEATIEQCINSIRAIGDFKIVVVDDGSSDGTSTIAESLRVKVVRKANAGAYGARALGLKYVCSEFVYFLDSDDEVRSSFISSVKLLDENPEFGCFLGSHVSVGDGMVKVQPQISGKLTAPRLINCHFGFGPISASLWRTQQAMKIIDHSPDALSLSRGDDYEMFIRCSLISNILCGDVIMVNYRLPGGKSTKNLALSLQCTIEIASYYATNFEVKYHPVPVLVQRSILSFRRLQVLFYEQGIYKIGITILIRPNLIVQYFIAKAFFMIRSKRFK